MLAGEPSNWLAHFTTLEERVAEAVEEVWPICIEPLTAKKGSMTHEDHITNHLVAALIKAKRLPGRLIPQYSLLTELANQDVTLSSNIDFVLTIGDDEDVYLACECKRLNVPYKSGVRGLVGEYIDEGLMRFVRGQYSKGLPLAMMLGYVMNAKVDRARNGLRRAMTVRTKAINLKHIADCPVLAGRSIRFTSTHQCNAGHDIDVAHTLLGWP
ncbi:MAG: hypothetical protein BGP05_10080 [Rhizobiales bacterium 62-47]|nr:hypothetical protein [Hyphomicrobiales bacterium]OJY14204.1 MAG: hypothetical protein BGP05_10080 [Rhizobiales bacterium 62-47]